MVLLLHCVVPVQGGRDQGGDSLAFVYLPLFAWLHWQYVLRVCHCKVPLLWELDMFA